MEKLQLKEKFLKEKPAMELPDGVKLYNGDFRNCSIQIPDNSIDLCLTDPPYSEKSLSLYKYILDVAQRVLKPGGSLITYCGTSLISEILKYLNDSELRFHWILAAWLLKNMTGIIISTFIKSIRNQW